MREYTYTVVFEEENGTGYHAFCPVLPGCHTQGETLAEAMENIKDAIHLYTKITNYFLDNL